MCSFVASPARPGAAEQPADALADAVGDEPRAAQVERVDQPVLELLHREVVAVVVKRLFERRDP